MVNQNGLPEAKRKVTKAGALWATEEQISVDERSPAMLENRAEAFFIEPPQLLQTERLTSERYCARFEL